jgi:hypothetical protein
MAPFSVAAKKSKEMSSPLIASGARTKPVDHVLAVKGFSEELGPLMPVNPALDAVLP